LLFSLADTGDDANLLKKLCGLGKKLSQLATALLVSPPIPKTPKHQHRIFFSKLHQVERIVNEEKAGNKTTKKKREKINQDNGRGQIWAFFFPTGHQTQLITKLVEEGKICARQIESTTETII